jgi:hypothetical protein
VARSSCLIKFSLFSFPLLLTSVLVSTRESWRSPGGTAVHTISADLSRAWLTSVDSHSSPFLLFLDDAFTLAAS